VELVFFGVVVAIWVAVGFFLGGFDIEVVLVF
jgi:hypothetical protein